MTPWIISHDLMRANEQEAVRATRYAHHRAHTYRRPGPFLASLLQGWMSKVPIPRYVHTAPTASPPSARDPLGLAVVALSGDADGAPMYRLHPAGSGDEVDRRSTTAG